MAKIERKLTCGRNRQRREQFVAAGGTLLRQRKFAKQPQKHRSGATGQRRTMPQAIPPGSRRAQRSDLAFAADDRLHLLAEAFHIRRQGPHAEAADDLAAAAAA
jgi:hypothetical protein